MVFRAVATQNPGLLFFSFCFFSGELESMCVVVVVLLVGVPLLVPILMGMNFLHLHFAFCIGTLGSKLFIFCFVFYFSFFCIH